MVVETGSLSVIEYYNYGSPEDEVTYGYIQEIHHKRLSNEEVREFIGSKKSL